MRSGPQARKGPPDGDFKYVLFAAYRTGSDWPHRYQLYHATVWSVDLEWPEWLPWIDVRTHAPAIAPIHTRWPIRPKGSDFPVPGARVSAIFTNDKAVRDVLFRKGWVDVSELYNRALEAHRAAQVAPDQTESNPVGLVAEIASRLVPPRRPRAAKAS